jgi:hypothetical protein
LTKQRSTTLLGQQQPYQLNTFREASANRMVVGSQTARGLESLIISDSLQLFEEGAHKGLATTVEGQPRRFRSSGIPPLSDPPQRFDLCHSHTKKQLQ